MRIVGIIQARMGSKRLPGKILKDICGKPMLTRIVERASRAIETIVATTTDSSDDLIAQNYQCFRGDVDDVLTRYIQTAEYCKADAVVRITGDCPLIEPEIIKKCVKLFQTGGFDYVSNLLPRTYPRGLDTEVVSVKTLKTLTKWREHVTFQIRENQWDYGVGSIVNPINFSYMRWCVDTQEDLDFVRKIYSELGDCYWLDAVQYLVRHPELIIKDTQEEPNREEEKCQT